MNKIVTPVLNFQVTSDDDLLSFTKKLWRWEFTDLICDSVHSFKLCSVMNVKNNICFQSF
jgi:hypothetical protein